MSSSIVDRETFLQNVRISKLLTSEQLRTVVERLGHMQNARDIAKAMASWNFLTKFQASMILNGRNSGFFLGPYRILELLGQGGMGRVYKALHQTMNRVVGLKVLSPQMVKTPKAHQLFLREVQAAAQLNHPNIVLAYDANEIDGRHYLAMEYVDGPNLEHHVRKHGALSVGLACELIFQTAAGLQHASDRGMVHRDIKPANLLFQREPGTTNIQVKILDFGLARLSQPALVYAARGKAFIEKDDGIMGTPDFLSPEQAANVADIDIRSDLYSIGCTLYYLLTGEVPFPGGGAKEKLKRHASEDPAPVETFCPALPRTIGDVVRKLMAKRPKDRFQSPDELMEELSPFAVPSAMDLHLAPPVDEFPDQAPEGQTILPIAQRDTEPRAQAFTQITDQESILEWVDVNRRERRRVRRKILMAALAIAGALAFGVFSTLAWWSMP